MTFTTKVKLELLDRDIYQLYGMLFARRNLTKSFSNKILGRYFYTLAKSLDPKSRIEMYKGKYLLVVDVEEILPSNREETISFLKGVFLANGYISNPLKDNSLDIYNLENYAYIKSLFMILDVEPKIYKNRLSLRSSALIKEVLLLFNAMESYFEYEDALIIKKYKSSSIGQVNFEIANDLRKEITLRSQMEAIQQIIDLDLYRELDNKLKEIVDIRVKNEEFSLQDIAKKLDISKSSVTRRFKMLKEIAKRHKK